MVIGNHENAILVVVFKVAEPKKSVLYEWAANAVPGLAARKKWIGVLRIPTESRICRKMMIPIVEK